MRELIDIGFAVWFGWMLRSRWWYLKSEARRLRARNRLFLAWKKVRDDG